MDTFHYIMLKVQQLLHPTIIKVEAATILSLTGFFFGDLYNQALMGVVMLMTMDTILGVTAAYTNGEIISSKKFSRSVLKGIVYFTSISAAYFCDLTIPYNFVQSTMIAFVGITEFISILENVGRLGYQTPKKLLNQLRDIKKNNYGQ